MVLRDNIDHQLVGGLPTMWNRECTNCNRFYRHMTYTCLYHPMMTLVFRVHQGYEQTDASHGTTGPGQKTGLEKNRNRARSCCYYRCSSRFSLPSILDQEKNCANGAPDAILRRSLCVIALVSYTGCMPKATARAGFILCLVTNFAWLPSTAME